MNNEKRKQLIESAISARKNAHAPYSKYLVGAAVQTKSGEIITGCNVENASYSLTICAERNALFSAVAQGFRGFDALAVVTDNCASPCGACRQVILDLCEVIPVIIADIGGNYKIIDSVDLLPERFNL